MYFLKLKGITDKSIFRNIYKNMDIFRLSNRTFILYEIPQAIEIPLKLIKAHAFLLDLCCFKELNEDALEDLVFDLIEIKNNILVKESGDEKHNALFYSLAADHGLEVRKWEPYKFDRKIDISNLNLNDFYIIKEIFQMPVEDIKFSEADFLLKYNITSDGLVYDEENAVIGNLYSDNLIEIINKMPANFKTHVDRLVSKHEETSFSPYFYEPWPFIYGDNETTEKIVAYKYKVFDAIKNIEPKDYPGLPMAVIDILNICGYITIPDIINVLGGKR